MPELTFIYSFSTFGESPKIDVEKLEQCQISQYKVFEDIVNMVVLCESERTADKLKYYFSIRYELFPKKQTKI
jgi:hypothetical protein